MKCQFLNKSLEHHRLEKTLLGINFLKDFIYLFYREEGSERGKETSMCVCLLCSLYWGPGLQPRHVP